MNRIDNLLKAGKITKAEAKRRRQQVTAAQATTVTRPQRRVVNQPNTPNVLSNILLPVITTTGSVIRVKYTEVFRVLHMKPLEILKSAVIVQPVSMAYLRTGYGIYQRYRFKQASVTWMPLTNSIHVGTIGIAPCNHDTLPSDIDLGMIANTPGNKVGPGGVGFTIPIPLNQYADDWYSTTAPAKSGNGGIEFMYWYQSDATAGEVGPAPAGQMKVSYVVEFTAPVMPRMLTENEEEHEDEEDDEDDVDPEMEQLVSTLSNLSKVDLQTLLTLFNKGKVVDKTPQQKDTGGSGSG